MGPEVEGRSLYAMLGFACVVGCLDLEPVRANFRVVDAGGTRARTGECQGCIRAHVDGQTACEPELLACSEEEKCSLLIECLSRAGCFEQHGQEETTKCAVPCALRVGVSSPLELGVQLLTQVAECGKRECPDVCY